MNKPMLHKKHLIGGVITIDPEIMSGTPCFKGTRVPIQNLFDHVRAGHPLDDFFEGFPRVTHEQVMKVLEMAEEHLILPLHENSPRRVH